jgi:hypothetical protein
LMVIILSGAWGGTREQLNGRCTLITNFPGRTTPARGFFLAG